MILFLLLVMDLNNYSFYLLICLMSIYVNMNFDLNNVGVSDLIIDNAWDFSLIDNYFGKYLIVRYLTLLMITLDRNYNVKGNYQLK